MSHDEEHHDPLADAEHLLEVYASGVASTGEGLMKYWNSLMSQGKTAEQAVPEFVLTACQTTGVLAAKLGLCYAIAMAQYCLHGAGFHEEEGRVDGTATDWLGYIDEALINKIIGSTLQQRGFNPPSPN